MSELDKFVHAAMRISVAQICQQARLSGANRSALEVLTDATIQYATHLGRSAAAHAELSGRTQCNLLDVSSALEDVGVKMTDLREVHEASQDHSSFPVALGALPASSSTGVTFPADQDDQPDHVQKESEKPRGLHIPPWLPPYPAARTYSKTPLYLEAKDGDPVAVRARQLDEKRKIELALAGVLREDARAALPAAKPTSSSYWGTLGSLESNSRIR